MKHLLQCCNISLPLQRWGQEPCRFLYLGLKLDTYHLCGSSIRFKSIHRKRYYRLWREHTSRLRHLNSHSSIDAFLHCPHSPFSFVFVFLYSFLTLELISFYRIVPFFLGISSFLLDSRFLPTFNPNPPPKSANRPSSIHLRQRVSTILDKCKNRPVSQS